MKKLKKLLSMTLCAVITISALTANLSAACTHTWNVNSMISATCTQSGMYYYICRLCGDSKQETIPALRHNYTNNNKVCTRSTACGAVYGSGSTWQYMFRLSSYSNVITEPYPYYNNGNPHKGIDITHSNFGEVANKPVYPVANGSIRSAGYSGDYGNLVKLQLNSYVVYYAHLSTYFVSTNQTVSTSATLGNVGRTGAVGPPPHNNSHCTNSSNCQAPWYCNYCGNHLHFEIRPSNDAENNYVPAYNPTSYFYPSGTFA